MLGRVLARSLYVLSGVLYLLAAGSVLLLGTGLLPPGLRDVIMDVAQGEPNTLHIMQEFSSLLVFAGLISLWFAWHYDRSLAFHWAMTTFWGLLALIHWFDIRGPITSAAGPAINSVPFLIYLAVGLLRLKPAAKAAASHAGEGDGPRLI
jgi:hypothetical protein